MKKKNNPLARYVYAYSITLSKDAKAEDFETRMTQDVLPHFVVLQRATSGMSLEHRLLKKTASRGGKRYEWLIRVLDINMVGNADEGMALNGMDEQLRKQLASSAAQVSLTIFSEIGVSLSG